MVERMAQGEQGLLEAVPGVLGVAVRPQLAEELITADAPRAMPDEQGEESLDPRAETRSPAGDSVQVHIATAERAQADHDRFSRRAGI